LNALLITSIVANAVKETRKGPEVGRAIPSAFGHLPSHVFPELNYDLALSQIQCASHDAESRNPLSVGAAMPQLPYHAPPTSTNSQIPLGKQSPFNTMINSLRKDYIPTGTTDSQNSPHSFADRTDTHHSPRLAGELYRTMLTTPVVDSFSNVLQQNTPSAYISPQSTIKKFSSQEIKAQNSISAGGAKVTSDLPVTPNAKYKDLHLLLPLSIFVTRYPACHLHVRYQKRRTPSSQQASSSSPPQVARHSIN
jgi:hypothetical protein